jgi:hypothetical protein
MGRHLYALGISILAVRGLQKKLSLAQKSG